MHLMQVGKDVVARVYEEAIVVEKVDLGLATLLSVEHPGVGPFTLVTEASRDAHNMIVVSRNAVEALTNWLLHEPSLLVA